MDVLNQQWGKYRIRRLIARGGMAEVFEADMTGPAGFLKPVCLKRVRPELSSNPEFVDMFQNEARIAAMLHHPNIVTVFDFDSHGKELFLVMELVEGMDLRSILQEVNKREFTLDSSFAVYVVDSLLAALEHAHGREVNGKARPVVHRDISPHNILVSVEGVVKLTDFGIAKSKGLSTDTRAGVIKGKLAYLSPEQLAGDSVGPPSDLYSVGLVLVEMLTGERLFKAENDAGNVVRRIQNSKLDKLPSVLMPFSELLQGLLAPKPAERFPSAKSARAALQRVAATTAGESDAAAMVSAFLKKGFDTGTLIRTRRMVEDAKPPSSNAVLAGVLPVSSRDAETAVAAGPPAMAWDNSDSRQHRVGPPARPARHVGLYILGLSVAVAILGAAVLFRHYLIATGALPRGDRTDEPNTSPPIEVKHLNNSHSDSDSVSAVSAEVSKTISEPVVKIPVDEKPPENEPGASASNARSEPLEAHAGGVSRKRRTGKSRRTEEKALSSNGPVPEVPPPEPVPLEPGRINVFVRPWAKVIVDGRSVGTTPVSGVLLKPGEHRLVLENQPLGYRETFPVTVEPGKTFSVTRNIKKKN